MSDDMAAAHARDSNDHQRMQDLSRTITAFLADPPRRTSTSAVRALTDARDQLDRDCAHIVAVWD